MYISRLLNSSPLRPRSTLPLPIPRAPIKHHKAPDLTRDQRRDILLLHDIGWKYKQIHCFTKATITQVHNTLKDGGKATPRKRCGRAPILTQAQIEELVEYVCSSSDTRRMTYTQLAEAMDFGVKRDAIGRALEQEGFHRRLAMRKPPISPTNQRLRYEWALEHVNWTLDQWYKILWTDETWITGGRHTKTWVSRRPGEEWDPTCVVEKHQKKKGWMFWGCFMDIHKGLGYSGKRTGALFALSPIKLILSLLSMVILS